MKFAVLTATAAAAWAMVWSAASAAPVYMSTPDLTARPTYAYCSDCTGLGFRAVDGFTLGSNTSVTGVQFVEGMSFPYSPIDLTLSIYKGSPSTGTLGPQVFSQTYSSSVYTAVQTTDSTLLIGLPVDNLQLTAGDYSIEFYNSDTLEPGGYDAPGQTSYEYANGAISATSPDFRLGYAISGGPGAPGPEVGLGLIPAAASLFALATTRLRRRKHMLSEA